MAQEIGSAYIQIRPSTRGLSKSIEGEMSGAFDSAARSGESKLGGLFKKVAKFGAAAVAVAGGFLTAKVIKGGLTRALCIRLEATGTRASHGQRVGLVLVCKPSRRSSSC